MLLTGPSASLDVIETADILSPFYFSANLDEFRVLNHHCMYDPKERLIRGENPIPSSQSIALVKLAMIWGR